MQLTDLTSIEQDVLRAMTAAAKHTTVVGLAADVWKQDDPTYMGDVVGMIQQVIENLAERGLLTYRIIENRGAEVAYYSGLAREMRLTQDGWALMGYPDRHYLAGSYAAQRQHLTHGSDMTNFRRHNDTAEGGEIERLPYWEHVRKYPHHVHTWTTEDQMAEKRNYVKVTPEMEGTILAVKHNNPLWGYGEIANFLNLGERTVKYVIVDMPRLKRLAATEQKQVTSLKQRILDLLEEVEMPDVASIRMMLGRADTDHDIVHVLHSLHKEGRVDFDEKGAHKEPVRIHTTKRPAQRKQAEKEQTVAVSNAVEAAIDKHGNEIGISVPAPTGPLWPELNRLYALEAQRQDSDARAMRYIEAAEILKDQDPEASAILLQKAEELNAAYPSPVEIEYMEYAKSHP
jgi:hypothetical protein